MTTGRDVGALESAREMAEDLTRHGRTDTGRYRRRPQPPANGRHAHEHRSPRRGGQPVIHYRLGRRYPIGRYACGVGHRWGGQFITSTASRGAVTCRGCLRTKAFAEPKTVTR